MAEPDAELLSGSEIDPFADAEIENRIESVEMRDAQNFSACTIGADAKRRSRRSNSKSAKRKSGKRTSSRPSDDETGDDDGGGNSFFRSGRLGTLRAGLFPKYLPAVASNGFKPQPARCDRSGFCPPSKYQFPIQRRLDTSPHQYHISNNFQAPPTVFLTAA